MNNILRDKPSFTLSKANSVSLLTLRPKVLFLIFILLSQNSNYCDANNIVRTEDISIASHRDNYDYSLNQQDLQTKNPTEFRFERFQSPSIIQNAMKNANRNSPFKWYQGKDGRKGYVSITKLFGDWVLTESRQVAVKCTTKDVLRAYLSGDLQQQWNSKEVLECNFHSKDYAMDNQHHPQNQQDNQQQKEKMNKKRYFLPRSKCKESALEGKQYQQDLVLRSQRVITSHTGIMRYSQIITIDKIGEDNYSVLVHLDPKQQQPNATSRKPFESLSVYVGLQQNGDNVEIYAAGVMKVNRKVVPNLVVFDASGIAGCMAGRGTLWLAGFFDKKDRDGVDI